MLIQLTASLIEPQDAEAALNDDNDNNDNNDTNTNNTNT